MTKLHILAIPLAAGLMLFGASAQAVQCTTSDVTFRGNDADSCLGSYPGENDSAGNLNTKTGQTDWEELDKYDVGQGSATASQTAYGVSWFIEWLGGDDWKLTWTDAPGGPGLPITLDIAVATKAGNEMAYYFFDGEEFDFSPNTGTGTFIITWTVGNNNPQTPGLSHLAIYGRNPQDCCREDVPEPGTLALLGLGLLGLGVTRRKMAH